MEPARTGSSSPNHSAGEHRKLIKSIADISSATKQMSRQLDQSPVSGIQDVKVVIINIGIKLRESISPTQLRFRWFAMRSIGRSGINDESYIYLYGYFSKQKMYPPVTYNPFSEPQQSFRSQSTVEIQSGRAIFTKRLIPRWLKACMGITPGWTSSGGPIK